MYKLTNKNINHIIYSSICFTDWNHGCTGIPKGEAKDKEFVLLTIAFDKRSNENLIPTEDPNNRTSNYCFQIYYSMSNNVYFRVFNWVEQKYLEWSIFLLQIV